MLLLMYTVVMSLFLLVLVKNLLHHLTENLTLIHQHYQQLLPMIEEVFQGRDVAPRYNVLEPTKKLVACMITCARLANQLDQAKEGEPPETIKHVGKFLQKVSYENVLVAVRSQIQIDRLVQFNLDEHPDWEQVLNKINKKVEE